MAYGLSHEIKKLRLLLGIRSCFLPFAIRYQLYALKGFRCNEAKYTRGAFTLTTWGAVTIMSRLST